MPIIRKNSPIQGMRFSHSEAIAFHSKPELDYKKVVDLVDIAIKAHLACGIIKNADGTLNVSTTIAEKLVSHFSKPSDKSMDDINRKDGIYPNIYDDMSNKLNCKIDSHIPKEDGLSCECGYFIRSVKVPSVPSVAELTNIISNFCSRPGFDEYTKCAEHIHNLITRE